MDAKIVELSEKIYVKNYTYSAREIDPNEAIQLNVDVYDMEEINQFGAIYDAETCAKYRLKKQAQESILAAEVFYQVKKECDK